MIADILQVKSVAVIKVTAAETREYHGRLVQWYIVIDQERCTVRPWSGSQPPFHPSSASNCSSTVGMNSSSHNEAFSSQLCSSGFQFHTQPSVSPLNGHHCPRHMRPRRILSTPPSCRTAESPLLPFVSLSLSSVLHTQSRTVTLLLWSRLCLCLHPSHLPTLFWCFSLPAPCVCLSTGVMSEVWWNLTSRSTGDDMPDESLNQYLLVFFSLFYFVLFIVFDSVPSKPTLRALYISSRTCCAGTAAYRRYLGSFGQPRPVGWLFPPPMFPLPASQGRQQRTAQLAYWSKKKGRRWPHSFPLSVAPGPQWLNWK